MSDRNDSKRLLLRLLASVFIIVSVIFCLWLNQVGMSLIFSRVNESETRKRVLKEASLINLR